MDRHIQHLKIVQLASLTSKRKLSYTECFKKKKKKKKKKHNKTKNKKKKKKKKKKPPNVISEARRIFKKIWIFFSWL